MISEAFSWMRKFLDEQQKPVEIHATRMRRTLFFPGGQQREYEIDRRPIHITAIDIPSFVGGLMQLIRIAEFEPRPLITIGEGKVTAVAHAERALDSVTLPLVFSPLWISLLEVHKRPMSQDQAIRFLKTIWRDADYDKSLRDALRKIDVTRTITDKREITGQRDKGLKEFATEIQQEIPEAVRLAFPVYLTPGADRKCAVEIVLDVATDVSPIAFLFLPSAVDMDNAKRAALQDLEVAIALAIRDVVKYLNQTSITPEAAAIEGSTIIFGSVSQ